MKRTENQFPLMSFNRIDFGTRWNVRVDARGWLQNPGKEFKQHSERILRLHSLLSCSRQPAVNQPTTRYPPITQNPLLPTAGAEMQQQAL